MWIVENQMAGINNRIAAYLWISRANFSLLITCLGVKTNIVKQNSGRILKPEYMYIDTYIHR